MIFLKSLIPKYIKSKLNRLLNRKIILKGSFYNWNEALKNSTGYNSNLIFDKTINSFKKVIEKKAKYERDSFLFYKDNPDKFLISLIKRLYKKKKINICDFGGSLGSLYYQNIKYLNKKRFTWNIVEQKKYVSYAKKNNLINDNLKFFYRIDDVFKKKIDLVIISSVLQYLKFPEKIINKIAKNKIKNLIILRTPLHTEDDKIMIQIVPKNIYPASYPIRIFNRKKFLKKLFLNNYKIKKEIKTLEEIDNVKYFGFYFVRI